MQHQVTTSTTDRFQRASKPCFVHVHAMTTTAILLGALTTVGCSSPPEPDRTDSAQFEGTVTLLNLTNEMHSITIDPLSTSVSIDCDAIEAYGVTPIHRRSFAPIARALQARQIDFIDHVSQ